MHRWPAIVIGLLAVLSCTQHRHYIVIDDRGVPKAPLQVRSHDLVEPAPTPLEAVKQYDFAWLAGDTVALQRVLRRGYFHVTPTGDTLQGAEALATIGLARRGFVGAVHESTVAQSDSSALIESVWADSRLRGDPAPSVSCQIGLLWIRQEWRVAWEICASARR